MVNYWVAVAARNGLEKWLHGYEYMRKQALENYITWSVNHDVADIEKDDIVAMYVGKPVSGIIGFGQVTRKYNRKRGPPIWPWDKVPIDDWFTIEMKLLWLAPSIHGGYIRLTDIPWFKGYERKGLQPIKNTKGINNFKTMLESTINYHKMLRRTSLY